jgi:hypothetical protein
MDRSAKMRVVMGRLEAARIDIEKTIDASESRSHWRTLVRSVLTYWLSELYNEGRGHTKDLQTSLDIARKQIEALKLVNADLQDEVRILRKTI